MVPGELSVLRIRKLENEGERNCVPALSEFLGALDLDDDSGISTSASSFMQNGTAGKRSYEYLILD